MSITRNRELSQFGSFIHIDDITQNIGITSLSTPFVGIGTTNPGFKLDVNGDINFNGTFYQNGTQFVSGFSRWDVSIGSSIYRLGGNVGIGTSVTPQKLTVLGNVSAGQFISTVTSGTAPLIVLSDTQVTNLNASFLRGKTPPTGNIVGTTDIQTLTNKTLTSPTLTTPVLGAATATSIVVGSAGITFNGSISGTTILQASAIASGTASGTLTLPAATDTLVGKATSDTLTNKSIAAGPLSTNIISGLTNTSLSGSAGISNANLANSTISGVALGSNLNALTFTDYLTSGGTYNGSTARTVSVAGTSINTGNTLVARDISGDFTAGTVTLSGLSLSGALVLSNTTESIDKDTGCLILEGGLGVEKNANIGGMLNVTGITTCAGGLDVTGGESTFTGGSGLLNQTIMLNPVAPVYTPVTVEFLFIPSWAKRITLMFKSLSCSGVSHFLVQLGTSSGFQTSGYTGNTLIMHTSANTALTSALGAVMYGGAAGNTISGSLVAYNVGDFIWVIAGQYTYDNVAGYESLTTSHVSLTNPISSIRLALTGVDTFDSGNINIFYEG